MTATEKKYVANELKHGGHPLVLLVFYSSDSPTIISKQFLSNLPPKQVLAHFLIPTEFNLSPGLF